MANKIFVTFLDAGAGADKDGVGVDCLVATLTAVQDAARIVANDLAARSLDAPKLPEPGENAPPSMRLIATETGSFVAELALESETGAYGARALESILKWDGYSDSGLPGEAVRKLHGIHSALPMDTRIWLGESQNRRMVEIKRVIHPAKPTSKPELALLYGWLKEVNWDKRTAQLHRYGVAGHVRLRFEKSLHDEMLRLATRHVEIRGSGKFNAKGDWTSVRIDSIDLAESGGEPFDLDAFLNNPNPKIFRGEDVIRASEPFDVDEFNRSIREGRNL